MMKNYFHMICIVKIIYYYSHNIIFSIMYYITNTKNKNSMSGAKIALSVLKRFILKRFRSQFNTCSISLILPSAVRLKCARIYRIKLLNAAKYTHILSISHPTIVIVIVEKLWVIGSISLSPCLGREKHSANCFHPRGKETTCCHELR